MKPLHKLACTTLQDGSSLELMERDGFYFLLQDGVQTASSFTHGSDDTAAQLAASPFKRANQPCFLIDGLGLGFTLAGLASEIKREKARFIVAEPLRELVAWHEQFEPHGAPGLLQDPRVELELTSVLQIARRSSARFHAIVLRSVHERLNLTVADAGAYLTALKGGGLLVITLSRSDNRLKKTLQKAGFTVSESACPASHKGKQTSFHTVLLAQKGQYVSHQSR